MSVLVVTSIEAGEGKTALGLALGRWFQGQGKRVGYLKSAPADGDVAFARKILNLTEEARTLAPAPEALAQSCAALSRDKDLLLVEGMVRADAVKSLAAKALLVVHYHRHSLAQAAEAAFSLGDSLLGVVINAVPRRKLFQTQAEADPLFASKGVRVLGLLPEDRDIFAPSIAELAQLLNGNIILYPEKADELVTAVMVGVLWVDPIPLYFGTRASKVVVARGDRPDVQLGALETPTCCLLLTGGIQPHPYVYYRAQDKGVPIMVVDMDTLSVLRAIENLIPQVRFQQEKKLPRLLTLLQENLDLTVITRSLN